MTALARAAGVHVSTMSRALRDDPSIPAETRTRLKAFAEKHGYQPDPALAALNAYRHLSAPRHFRAVLAALATSRWRQNPASAIYLDGARKRAAELGYTIEMFIVNPPEMTGTRLAGILRARHIQGVLVLPLPETVTTLEFPWTEFSSVAFGFSMAKPTLNRISVNNFGAMIVALTRLHGIGYQRPGLWLSVDRDVPESTGMMIVSRLWEGAYRTEMSRLFSEVNIPILREKSPDALRRWIKAGRPDVIITQHSEAEEMLRAIGFEVPRQLGIVHTLVDGNGRWTGVHQNSEFVGRRAVDMVVRMLHHYETGLPAVPVNVLVETSWQDGLTTKRWESQPKGLCPCSIKRKKSRRRRSPTSIRTPLGR